MRRPTRGTLLLLAKRRVAWVLLQAADRLAPRRAPTADVVLLVAANQLMADYVVRLWRCVADLHPGGAVLTEYPGLGPDERHTLAAEGIGIVRAGRARWQRWKLLLLADHMPLEYLPSIPRVIVPHGVARARQVREGSYYYDAPRLFWPDGRPVYAVMLDASHASAEWGGRRFPAYADRIVVTGDLRVDELLARASEGADRRRELGWEGREIIGVMSTWSSGALVPATGHWLIEHLQGLVAQGRHAVVITMHPNLWDPDRCGTDRWVRLISDAAGPSIHVVRPDEDWAPALAVADCLLTDHTSLAATWSMLRRPMIPVDVPLDVVGEGTFARWLLDSRDPVRNAVELDRALGDLTRYARFEGAPPVVDHLGEAATRTRAALAPFLS